jgi:cytochrome c oxidase subunit 3
MENQKANNIESIQSSITMTVLLISFSMLFGTLFLGYMVYRVRATVWPPMGMSEIGLFYPSFSTVVIFLSSITYYFFEKLLSTKKISSAKKYLYLSFLLGLVFVPLNIWFGEIWR